MGKVFFLLSTIAVACCASASWYWPFGSDSSGGRSSRLSTLMEPASLLIDEASDLATDGKFSESIEKYREALEKLDLIEMENPERAKTPEFATLRTKRAYVNAAIDSLLLSQVRDNAKAVAVSDTTVLEAKLRRERWQKHATAARDMLRGLDERKSRQFCDEIATAHKFASSDVLHAALYGLEAAACFLQGNGKGCCQALDRFRDGLGKGSELSEKDVAAARGGLRDIRALAIDRCDAAVASGTAARAAFDRLVDLQRTNAAEDVVSAACADIYTNLVKQCSQLSVYPFEQAVALSNETVVIDRQLKEMKVDQVDWTTYDAALEDFKALIAAFGGVRRRLAEIEARLSPEVKPAEVVANSREGRAPSRPQPRQSAALPCGNGDFATVSVEPKPAAVQPTTKREKVIAAISSGDYVTADKLIKEMLAAKPNNALALNLKATMEIRQGKLKEADETLGQAIQSNPHSHFAYYNLAILTLKRYPDAKDSARRYYETGRAQGNGPQDLDLEAMLK